ncbi:HDOD domain-containing protein [Ectothiorhodospira variabilis]|uniref:HDOD domain-containing protein n=1 Tax=Ectothiorhodospira variabilis TaxID=505694 RepID=UPI001EFB6D49|nr:HDOD domain-containing protein [Ectothiorhodospira variabilis]MCG5495606.1 HDOD domain-containing protein [Ectothiorhodospira variabilis]MCG5503074.1 HDOD domain-containing protein [Ectothiorhodospira variabilis]MCG5506167.1 HDOD domain-containing protein [Ectothiorhodospira variabilis]
MSTHVAGAVPEKKTLAEWTVALRERDMPVFSNTVQAINAIIEDEKKGAMEMATVILQDPNLTARILKLSNSSYFNPGRRKIITVTRAIVIIGIDVIREMVLACAFFEAILSASNKNRAHEEIARAIHSAVQAKYLAIATQDPFPEEVFIAALLQNIGHIAFWCFSGEEGDRLRDLLDEGTMNQQAAEREVLGFKLTDLDVALCKSWNLKGLIEETVSKHGRVREPRVKLVHLGCEVVNVLKDGEESRQYPACLEKIASLTGQTRADIEAQLQKNTESAASIARQFGATEAAELIQRKARELIDHEGALASQMDRSELQVQVLRDISGILSTRRLDINLLLETIMEGIQRGLGMDRTLFAALSSDRSMLQEKVALGWRDKRYAHRFTLPLVASPPNLFHKAIFSPEAHWFTPEGQPALYSPADVDRIGRHPCFVMSLHSGDKPVGVVYADRAYSEEPLSQEAFRAFEHFVQQGNIGLTLYRLQGS